MAGSPQGVLAVELRRLHRSAGEPGTREIAKAIKFSHTTVAQALNGSRCPKWNAVEAMVRHLGGNVEAFRPLWQAVRDVESSIPAPPDRLPLDLTTNEVGRSRVDRGTDTATNDASDRMDTLGVFVTNKGIATEMAIVLSDPSLTEVRLLGLSLSNWFGGRGRSWGSDWPGRQLERLLLEKKPDSAPSAGIHVRVLDPGCRGLRLLTYGTGSDTDEEMERLRNEIRETAEHLTRLSDDVAQWQTGNSLQLRFSRTVPPFFLFAVQQSMFTRSYYHGLAIDSRARDSSAVWHFNADSSAYQTTCRHFDAIWDADSVSGEELMRHKSVGIDQGISESGIVNIYTSRERAQERIQWLVSHAEDRV